jgi:SAM-dependent methyltransferase
MLNLDKQERYRQRYKTDVIPGHQMGLDIYRDWLADLITPQARVLDVGCGPAGLVADYDGYAAMVVGADRYLTNFSEFDGRFGISHLAEGDLTALPFESGTFDVVTCSWVLEHLAEPLAATREIARVLAPGGRFVFITPNALNYVVLLRRLVPDWLSKPLVKAIYARDEDFINPTYYRMNTPQQVSHICEQAGLQQQTQRAISDPTYLALNDTLFHLTNAAERLLEAVYPQGRVHLVGMYNKPHQDDTV